MRCDHPIRRYVRRHPWIADLSSLLAVMLFFLSIWAIIFYRTAVMQWIEHGHWEGLLLTVIGIALDVGLIFALLAMGSSCIPDAGPSFGTFRGRRHGGSGPYEALQHWVAHIENVGKRHR